VVTAAILAQDTLTILTGVAATLCLTAAPMFRTRRMILLAQLAAGIFFAAHYLCLGIVVAAVANMLGTAQTGAALLAARSAAMGWLGYVLIGLMVLVGFYFWQGPISALSVAAIALIALGRMQSNELRLRVLLLGGGFFWAIHDFIGEAWIALTADVGAATMGAAALFSLLFRVTIERRQRSPASMVATTQAS
jgi:Bacterial inner membrane protein